jgi:hypothetical protein
MITQNSITISVLSSTKSPAHFSVPFVIISFILPVQIVSTALLSKWIYFFKKCLFKKQLILMKALSCWTSANGHRKLLINFIAKKIIVAQIIIFVFFVSIAEIIIAPI